MSRGEVASGPRLLRVPAALAGTLLLAGAGIAVDHLEIDQSGRAFSVATLRAHVGETIDFMNKDDFDHQIYVDSPGFSFESDESAPGETVSLRLTEKGTFQVRCHIHPKMLLTLDVN